ncbi:MAG: hypothetical protein KME46_04860 [Brasilonema angustatum HA4187-MV1]|nr:hypothetical protein [Brasilonema angustatum HA4187-MV1]
MRPWIESFWFKAIASYSQWKLWNWVWLVLIQHYQRDRLHDCWFNHCGLFTGKLL